MKQRTKPQKTYANYRAIATIVRCFWRKAHNLSRCTSKFSCLKLVISSAINFELWISICSWKPNQRRAPRQWWKTSKMKRNHMKLKFRCVDLNFIFCTSHATKNECISITQSGQSKLKSHFSFSLAVGQRREITSIKTRSMTLFCFCIFLSSSLSFCLFLCTSVLVSFSSKRSDDSFALNWIVAWSVCLSLIR